MALNLVKGQRMDLGLKRLRVGLGWEFVPGKVFDLDVAAVMISAKTDKVPNDNYFVFYNSEMRIKAEDVENKNPNPQIVFSNNWANNNVMRGESHPVDPEVSVIGSIDNEGTEEEEEDGDAETMTVNLDRVSDKVDEILFVVSIYNAENQRSNFGQVKNAYLNIYNADTDELIAHFDLEEDYSVETVVECGKIYRRNGGWRFQGTGDGYTGGLQAVVNKYC